MKKLVEEFSTKKTPQADGVHVSLLRLGFTPKLGAPQPHQTLHPDSSRASLGP